MKFDIEDPRLTAYLLDELDAAERAEVEALLSSNAEARDFIDSMRGATEALGAELSGESLSEPADAALGDLRRARIAKAAKNGGSRRWLAMGGGVAAALAAVAVFGITTRGEDELSKTDRATVDRSVVALGTPVSQKSNDPAVTGSPSQIPAGAFEPDSPDPKLGGEMPRPEGHFATTTSTGTGAGGSFSKMTGSEQGASLDSSIAAARGHAQGQGYGNGYGKSGMRGRRNENNSYAESRDATQLQDPVAGAGDNGLLASEKAGDDLRGVGTLGYLGRNAGHSYRYDIPVVDNPFVAVGSDPLSTFSIDVDTASYSQMRRQIRNHSLPAPSSVRIEELINYFDYQYPGPDKGEPFGVITEVAQAPWNTQHKLVRIGVKAREIVQDRRPRANLVFLLDVSGSMSSEDKLPLLKRSFGMLLGRLDKDDRIAIVVYAGASGLALPSTSVAQQKTIMGALGRLKSGGSTNGGAGIELAYKIAQENFVEGGVNRVILATDGDFNVGNTSRTGLITLIEDKAKHDIFLTVLGVGMTNYSDGTMEQLADKGNGNYAFIDTLAEAKKVLVDQVHSTLVTVAKDVKLQVEFNPARVAQYRLIGYENRVLAHEDFNNDAKDAGDIGAGHAVTALYEIVPPGATKVDDLRYQTTTPTSTAAASDELLTLKLRYKEPTGSTSRKNEIPVFDSKTPFGSATGDFKFASAVAAFGMILRGSEHCGDASLAQVLDWATEGRGDDAHEYRAEFIQLVRQAIRLRR